LSVNDELLFLDNYRLTAANAATILDSRDQGEKATFVVNRDGLMRTFRLKPSRPPLDSLTLVQVAEPTARQKRLYTNWLGTAWE
jgi:predicted metalloprotease with PDZ domain